MSNIRKQKSLLTIPYKIDFSLLLLKEYLLKNNEIVIYKEIKLIDYLNYVGYFVIFSSSHSSDPALNPFSQIVDSYLDRSAPDPRCLA